MLFTTGIAVPVIAVLCSRVRVLRRSYLRNIRQLTMIDYTVLKPSVGFSGTMSSLDLVNVRFWN